jgi:hypothetical protein
VDHSTRAIKLIVVINRHISNFPTTYKILSTIFLSMLIQYAEEIMADHKCGFRRNSLATDHMLCISQILEKMGSVKQYISY